MVNRFTTHLSILTKYSETFLLALKSLPITSQTRNYKTCSFVDSSCV
ncbi:hypothetical protein E2C01_102244 [Portunus trituberculatus]|uniref:Uncharacterized protein n=1 Tax=Portunus trituberculatus TaxID=210409 RepID=A0A5B7KGU0_PORTR|nr:hypothetical protein [Portunus trituberculatus]